MMEELELASCNGEAKATVLTLAMLLAACKYRGLVCTLVSVDTKRVRGICKLLTLSRTVPRGDRSALAELLRLLATGAGTAIAG